jgi:hypothetical protein
VAVTVTRVVEQVEAAKPQTIEETVREVIRALGHEVANDGQVYNPAEGCYRPAPVRVVPRDQRWAGRRR